MDRIINKNQVDAQSGPYNPYNLCDNFSDVYIGGKYSANIFEDGTYELLRRADLYYAANLSAERKLIDLVDKCLPSVLTVIVFSYVHTRGCEDTLIYCGAPGIFRVRGFAKTCDPRRVLLASPSKSDVKEAEFIEALKWECTDVTDEQLYVMLPPFKQFSAELCRHITPAMFWWMLLNGVTREDCLHFLEVLNYKFAEDISEDFHVNVFNSIWVHVFPRHTYRHVYETREPDEPIDLEFMKRCPIGGYWTDRDWLSPKSMDDSDYNRCDYGRDSDSPSDSPSPPDSLSDLPSDFDFESISDSDSEYDTYNGHFQTRSKPKKIPRNQYAAGKRRW